MNDDMSTSTTAPTVSIVVPVRNEADNVAPLVDEIAAALDGRWAYEIVYVDDGSTDATAERLAVDHGPAQERASDPPRKIIGTIGGGSDRGARRARPIVATLDGDGQNNPAFLPELIMAIEKRRAIALVLPPANASAARIPDSRNSSRGSPTRCEAGC